MTKMKSKKMTKSTFAIIIMAIAMVAMLAFGGTYAYFTATANSGSVEFTTGYVHLSSNAGDAFVLESGTIFPYDGNYILGSEDIDENVLAVEVATDDAAGNYVAVKYIVKVNDVVVSGSSELLTKLGLAALIMDDSNWTDGTVAQDGIYFYQNDSDNTADSGLIPVLTAGGVEFDVDDNWAQEDFEENEENYISEKGLMGVKISIEFEAHSIQATGVDFATAQTELVDMFTVAP